jgi:acetyltransferase-like isoleucine patch superfamily enzyme
VSESSEEVSDGYSPLEEFIAGVSRLGELADQGLVHVEVSPERPVTLRIDRTASDLPAHGTGVYLDVCDVLGALAAGDPIDEFVASRSGAIADDEAAREREIWKAKFDAAAAAFPPSKLTAPLTRRARARVRRLLTDAVIAIAKRSGRLGRAMSWYPFRRLLGVRGRREAWRAMGAQIADTATLGADVVLRLPHNVSVGAGTKIAGRVRIEAFGKITIGRNVLLNDADLFSAQHDVDHPRFSAQRRTVTIGDYAWLPHKIIVLPGVRIGSYAVVGTGSVVARDVPDYGVAVGNPAQVVKERARIRYTYVPASVQRSSYLA